MALGADLFALYHFNNDWTDATGNGNDDVTVTGATFNASVKMLGSHSGNFDGNDKVQIENSGADPTDFNVTELTIFCWYYYEEAGTHDPIVAKRDGATSSGEWQFYIRKAGKKIEFNWNNGGTWRGGTITQSTGVLTNNAWNFIGMRFSSANLEVEFILNGNIETPISVTHVLDPITKPVYLGWDIATSYAFGRIDELACYDVLKSGTDVSDYWNGGSGAEITPEVGGRVMSSLVNRGGLVSYGGIAGQGGGLAG